MSKSGPLNPIYDALVGPDPALWLGLDESERIPLIEDYHRRIRAPVPRSRRAAHFLFHAIVETNVASGEEPVVRTTLERLIGEGLDRHEAIHAIAGVFASMINAIVRDQSGFDPDKCRKALEQLTAASRTSGAWE